MRLQQVNLQKLYDLKIAETKHYVLIKYSLKTKIQTSDDFLSSSPRQNKRFKLLNMGLVS